MDCAPLPWSRSPGVLLGSPGSCPSRNCCPDCSSSRQHRASPSVLAVAALPPLSAVLRRQNGRRRRNPLLRKASVGDRKLEQHLVEQVTSRGGTLKELKGKRISGLECPKCHGGEQGDTAFSVRLEENDKFDYECHQCGFRGELRPTPTSRRLANLPAAEDSGESRPASVSSSERKKLVPKGVVSQPSSSEGKKPVPKGVARFVPADRQLVMDRIRGLTDPTLISGVSTGWPSLDEYYRVVPGELTIITGKPGSGKSEWLLSLASNIASQQGWRFLLFSFESDDRYLAIQIMEKRMQKQHTEIPLDDIDRIFSWVDKHFVLGHDAFASSSIDEILGLAEKEAQSEQGLQGMIIDPYNFINRSTTTSQFETDFISEMLSKIKRFAHKYKVHVWIIAHPTKSSSWESESKPSLYNISGSANWFNKADMGIVVERKVLLVGDDVIPDRKVELHVEKVRNKDAGQLGKVELVFAKDQRGYVGKEDCFQEMPEAVGVH